MVSSNNTYVAYIIIVVNIDFYHQTEITINITTEY